MNGFRVLALAALVALVFASGLAYAEKKESVAVADLPSEIKQAIEKEFPGGEILAIEKEVEGEDPGQYDVEIRMDGKEYEVEIAPDGSIKETKETEKAEIAKEAEENSAKDASAESKKWTESFDIDKCTFASVGRNKFFILEPGFQIVLANDEDKVTITVLDETKMIGKVETRIVEEREEEGGELIEVSRNFFAFCKEYGDVFYFGEEVDEYKDGKISSHSGAWRADEADSKAGIIMPGRILLGARHYQEIAPNAMDRAELVADDVTMKTPAGNFENCLRVEETSGLNAKERAYKTYAPNVGLIQDEDLLLTSYGKAR